MNNIPSTKPIPADLIEPYDTIDREVSVLTGIRNAKPIHLPQINSEVCFLAYLIRTNKIDYLFSGNEYIQYLERVNEKAAAKGPKINSFINEISNKANIESTRKYFTTVFQRFEFGNWDKVNNAWHKVMNKANIQADDFQPNLLNTRLPFYPADDSVPQDGLFRWVPTDDGKGK